jgi:hypothetical protein
MIGACASTPSYMAASSDKAQLRLSVEKGGLPANSIGDTMTTYIFDSGSCENKLLIDLVYTTGIPKNPKPDALDMPLPVYSKSSMHEFEIAAGIPKSMLVEFRSLQGGPLGKIHKCNIAIDQTFKTRGQYELHGVFLDTNTCKLTLNEFVTDNGDTRRVEIANFTQETHPAPETCELN